MTIKMQSSLKFKCSSLEGHLRSPHKCTELKENSRLAINLCKNISSLQMRMREAERERERVAGNE